MNRPYLALLAAALATVSVMAALAAQTASPLQTPRAEARSPTAQVSVQEINDGFVEKIAKQIVGHEQEPAEKVFANIQILRTVPAGRLLLIMNRGYSHALGVTCTHCHVEQDFSSDEKRPKRAAREMALMYRSINEQLAKMQNLEPNPEGHSINCTTCHRGAVNPMAPEK